jgi:hypothetical protein
VYCVELYGIGRSERRPFRAKNAEEAEDLMVAALERWRQAVGLEEPFVLAGHRLVNRVEMGRGREARSVTRTFSQEKGRGDGGVFAFLSGVVCEKPAGSQRVEA